MSGPNASLAGDGADRRPLTSRNTRWAGALARRLARGPLTPNGISMLSVVFATLAGAAFWASGRTEGGAQAALLVAAALGCQLRLLCNLLDGMVAVEGGRGTPDGPFWNEAPDRVADVVILVGAGLGAHEPALGWAVATLAVGTAYMRELGRANGTGSDFGGPMAKPHRMALMTGGALVAAVVSLLPVGAPVGALGILEIALWIVAAGALLTVVLRSRRLSAALNERQQGRRVDAADRA